MSGVDLGSRSRKTRQACRQARARFLIIARTSLAAALVRPRDGFKINARFALAATGAAQPLSRNGLPLLRSQEDCSCSLSSASEHSTCCYIP